LAGCPSPTKARHGKTDREPEEQSKPTHGFSPYFSIYPDFVDLHSHRCAAADPRRTRLRPAALDFAPRNLLFSRVGRIVFFHSAAVTGVPLHT
jgi:hypothetical protein